MNSQKNNIYQTHGKRWLDIAASLMGLILLSPCFVIIECCVKLSSKGPIFFIQKRIGQNFQPFQCYKFRTMIENADKIGLSITSQNDPRITPMGKFLRKTKLDELPQLLNVLKGDMSLVGPRPEMECYVTYAKKDYEEILKIKPGITDYAAIVFKDEEKILAQYQDKETAYKTKILPIKIKLYKKYLKSITLKTDLKLILKTLTLHTR